MTTLIIFSVFVAVAYIAFRLAVIRHPEREAVEAMNKRLLPVVAVVEPVEKEELWRIIGHLRGVWDMFTGARHVTTLAAARAKIEPCTTSAVEEIICDLFVMRLLLPLVAMEALFCQALPAFPRAFAGAFVKLFCELMVTFEAAESIGSQQAML